MEQGIIDWTAFLEDDDDNWFLPDPPPAGVELIDAPLPYLGSSCDEVPECSADCFWGRSNFNGPFAGFEERVAALGHFGMGFPEGHLPETVPGTFTGTEVEQGRSTLVDDGILDIGRCRDSSDDCTRDDSAGILPDNESQIELSIGTLEKSDAVQQEPGSSELASSETGQDTRPAPASSKKDFMGGDAVTDVDRMDHALSNAVACPNNTADGEYLEYQGTSDHEDIGKHSGYVLEERDDWVPEPVVEMKHAPKKYQRKRKIQKSSEFGGQDQCDSDSDYTPEPRQKKRARITTPPARNRQRAGAKKPNVWFAKGRTKPLKKATLAHNVDKGTAVDYAPIANKAQFATSAKRARFALEATTIRRQSGISDENVENAPYTFSELYKEFQRAKQQTIGKGSKRNIQQVVFADRAVDAEFAQFAVAAEVIISVG
ncbi:hypothetical protein MY10362_004648 [Beauveria mimosiformis]